MFSVSFSLFGASCIYIRVSIFARHCFTYPWLHIGKKELQIDVLVHQVLMEKSDTTARASIYDTVEHLL